MVILRFQRYFGNFLRFWGVYFAHFRDFGGILVILWVLGVFWSFFWVFRVFWSFLGFGDILDILEVGGGILLILEVLEVFFSFCGFWRYLVIFWVLRVFWSFLGVMVCSF